MILARKHALALIAAGILTGAVPASAVPPVESHVLVGGAVNFGFTRKTASCLVKDGRLISFQTPDVLRDALPPPPDLTGMLLNGAWDVEVHSRSRRFFKGTAIAGVVVRKMQGTWKVELHNVKLPEDITMKIDYASVNGTIICTSTQDLPD